MDSKISQFTAQTGVDSTKAKTLLHEHKGNVAEAVKTYKLLQAALPPAGPQKNVNGTSNATTLDKKLKRGLSKSSDNAQIVTKARELVLQDIVEDGADGALFIPHLAETSEYTFILPDITQFTEDFKAFLHKDLIETSTLVSLEQAGRLNWWADLGACQRLMPLATTGDGNCLLHAASLGMWGFHDRQLTLRKALHTTLQNSCGQSALWRRWRWHQTQANKQSGLILSEEEWREEWNYLLRQSSAKPRTTPGTTASCCDSPATKGLMERTTEEKENEEDTEVFYESLEEFHVFILAHVLHRPIVIVADTILKDADGGALAPIPFGGIYLPLECKPVDCHRSPLLLTYDAAHFSALVAMEMKSPADSLLPIAIPLVDPDFELLHIHFLVDPGPEFVWGRDDGDDRITKELEMTTEHKLSILRKYLDIAPIPIPRRRSSDEGSEEPLLGLQHRSSSFSGALDQKASSSSGGSTDSNLLSSGENIQIKEKSNTLDGKLKPNFKDYKDKTDKSKVAKQITKSFNSLGRSMSKKFKKMGKIHLNNREDGAIIKTKRTSIGSMTQSTKVNQIIMLEDKEKILSAQLQLKRLHYQDEMVSNYMEMARRRFEQDRDLKRLQDVEMMRKAEQRNSMAGASLNSQQQKARMPTTMECINKECKGMGSSDTCYLCPQCYNQQKQEEIHGITQDTKNISNSKVPPKNPNLEKCRSNLAEPESSNLDDSPEESSGSAERARMPRQNTLIETGKSKFYTYDDEEHSLPVITKTIVIPVTSSVTTSVNTSALNNTAVSTGPALNNAKFIRREHNPTRAAAGTAVELSRSSFYDEALSFDAASKAHALKSDHHFVNNLHNEWRGEKDNSLRHDKHYSKPPPLAKEYTNEMTHVAAGGSPTRKQAFKIKESQVEKTYSEYELAMQNIKPKNMNVKNENLTNIAPAKAAMLQRPCKESGCKYYGTIATDFYCSACFKRVQRTLAYKASQYDS